MWRNNLPRVNLLSEDEVDQIHRQAMVILNEIGVDFLHPKAIELFKAAGMPLEGERVRFEEAFIVEQVNKAPETFEVQARNPKNTVTIGGNHMVNAPVYGPPFITDLDRGRRGATIEDFSNFDKMSQATPQIHCAGGTTVEPEDLPLGTRHLDMVYSHIRWTDKPYMGGVISEEAARDSIELSSIVFGGRAAIERTPAMLALVNVNSPLRYDDRIRRRQSAGDRDAVPDGGGHVADGTRRHHRAADRRGARRHRVDPAGPSRRALHLRVLSDQPRYAIGQSCLWDA